MKSYFFKRPELTDAQTSEVFLARRRIIRVPLGLLIVTLILNFGVDAVNILPIIYKYFHMGIFIIAALLVFYAYRCPRCGEPPKSSQKGTSGVLIFPRKCSKCGAPLMPNHKWVQD